MLIHIDTYWYILIHTDTYWYEYNHLISLAITCDNQIYLSKWDQVLWSWASSDHERNNLCMFQKKHNMFGKQRASPNRNEKMGMRPSSAGQSSPLSKSIPVFRILQLVCGPQTHWIHAPTAMQNQMTSIIYLYSQYQQIPLHMFNNVLWNH